MEAEKEQSAIPALSSQKPSATQGGEFLSPLNKIKQHAFLKSLLLPVLKGALVVVFFFSFWQIPNVSLKNQMHL